MVVGYKPQGNRKSIAANTSFPPQDPPKPVIVEPIRVPEIIVPKPIVKIPQVKVEKKVIVPKVIITPKVTRLTLRQRIISFLKRIMRK